MELRSRDSKCIFYVFSSVPLCFTLPKQVSPRLVLVTAVSEPIILSSEEYLSRKVIVIRYSSPIQASLSLDIGSCTGTSAPRDALWDQERR
jgi:hypothetical protein